MKKVPSITSSGIVLLKECQNILSKKAKAIIRKLLTFVFYGSIIIKFQLRSYKDQANYFVVFIWKLN